MASERLVCLPRTIFSNLSEQIVSKDFTESFVHSRKYHFLSISTFHFIYPVIFAPLHTRDHSLNIKKKDEGARRKYLLKRILKTGTLRLFRPHFSRFDRFPKLIPRRSGCWIRITERMSILHGNADTELSCGFK